MKPSTEINATIDYRKIGVHLKEARKANSLSQAQVAAFLHISVCAYALNDIGAEMVDHLLVLRFALCVFFEHAEKQVNVKRCPDALL